MKKIILLLLTVLVIWILSDLFIPRKNSLRNFDPLAVAALDSDMWRSYYERKRLKLFFQLSQLMRRQFKAPFWRSFPIAYRAAKAAIVFQEGSNREDYAKALPHLEKYFDQINQLSDQPFDTKWVAEKELEWWIIRREPQHSSAEWEALLAEVSAGIYHLPKEKFKKHASLRVEAMLYRDSKREEMLEEDWEKITRLLERSWQAMFEVVQ